MKQAGPLEAHFARTAAYQASLAESQSVQLGTEKSAARREGSQSQQVRQDARWCSPIQPTHSFAHLGRNQPYVGHNGVEEAAPRRVVPACVLWASWSTAWSHGQRLGLVVHGLASRLSWPRAWSASRLDWYRYSCKIGAVDCCLTTTVPDS